MKKHISPYGYNFKFQFSLRAHALRAECAGFTKTRYTTLTRGQGQYAFETKRDNFFESSETLHGFFPNAERFATEEAAALECDFWKFVLSREFRTPELPYSHGCLSNFLGTAMAAGLNVERRAEDRTAWGLELAFFVSSNQGRLSQCRDVGTPQLPVPSEFLSTRQEDLRTWAQKRVDAESLKGAIENWDLDHKLRRLETFLGYERILSASRREVVGQFNGSPNSILKSLSDRIQCALYNIELSAYFSPLRALMEELEMLKLRASDECAKLDEQRPTIDFDKLKHSDECSSAVEKYGQQDVT